MAPCIQQERWVGGGICVTLERFYKGPHTDGHCRGVRGMQENSLCRLVFSPAWFEGWLLALLACPCWFQFCFSSMNKHKNTHKRTYTLLHLTLWPGPVQGQHCLALLIHSITLQSVDTQCHIIKYYLHPETQALCVSHMTPLWFLKNSGNSVTWSSVERGTGLQLAANRSVVCARTLAGNA